ncbi:hypothetical protein KDA00_04715, partial [Candidatus Saccharibacteria bacterium]|nr:hypothetical protein [Candidatus Saccharibacteria bacterium]
FEGLKQVIRYSHDEENRSYLAELEHRFTEAIPNIREIVDMAYDENGDRLAQINPSLPLLKPAPIYDPIVYRYICHSRLEKITTERLLDGFNPSPFFGNLFQNRTLNSLSPKLRSVPKIA